MSHSKLHASSHVGGDDAIQLATAAQDGLATSAQITKLDGIEAGADVTDSANVTSSLGSASLTAVTVASDDKVIIQDTSDSNNIKTVTASQFLGGGPVEGTAILSTGEVGGTKFLREDGDGTCSWQTVSAGSVEGVDVLSTGVGYSGRALITFGDGTSLWGYPIVKADNIYSEAQPSGKVLTSNGAGATTWESPAGGTPAGADTQVQFNNSGSFGADADFTFGPAGLRVGDSYTSGVLGIDTNYATSCFALGFATNYGRVGTLISTPAIGSMALGNADGANSAVQCAGNGTLVNGEATATSSILGIDASHTFGMANNNSSIYGAGMGSLCFGRSINGGYIQTSSSGAFAGGLADVGGWIKAYGGFYGGFCHGSSSGGSLIAYGNGTFTHGCVENGGIIKAGFSGATAFGFSLNGQIESIGKGATACGYTYGAYGNIKAFAYGGFATGCAKNSDIRAYGSGDFACGYASSTSQIHVSGYGAMAVGCASNTAGLFALGKGCGAFGYVGSGTLQAGYNGSSFSCFQFGTGVNTIDFSLQVGDCGGGYGLRLRANSPGIPTPAQNGDIWQNAGYVYIQSNGVAVKIV